ncbi:uncharacterized protein I206_106754 [Kwoniella pini CBS 10737]|uniref:Uncharacterized protein n=1 Tax=Kwoniella pini CBS 10737 TaxID=1296096 RepID=A0A1B9HTB1_9TREE|nr:uncharacterized protein I206_07358 [Kwoniella pini CBS 10737]OCF46505.1 hypothetical protein I206_07358 [Kwoniella pini CBS 10737]
MNKRGPSGLPTKPYIQNNGPGPAPPLPAGPPPQMQQPYPQGQVDQAAHAAAWAAYYQAQGVNPGTASYSAAAQPATPAPVVQGTANPYANYGYGGGAQHTGYQPVQGQQVGPSQPFRPPPNTQAYATTNTQPSLGYQQPPSGYPQQPQAYSPNPTAGYSTPQPQPQPIQGQGRPPFVQQQQNYNWGAQQTQALPQQPQQGYGRPPPVQQQAYTPQAGPAYPQQPQQPSQPFAGGNQPYRPAAPAQHSPYRPPINQHRPPRPPISTPVGGGFPPAKRPRFDGPGIGGVRPPNAPMQMQNSPTPSIRPPSAPAAFNAGGVNGGQPGFGNTSVASRGGLSGSVGRGGAPIPPSRPPIHLGGGGPPPFGIGLGRGGSLRGGRGGRGGSVGVVGAPRGPSVMRVGRGSLPPAPIKKDTSTHNNTPKKEKRKEELRTTMTDFRIIGIEVKGLDWSWGKINGEEEVEEEISKTEAVAKVEDPLISDDLIKAESVEATKAEQLEDKAEIKAESEDTGDDRIDSKEQDTEEVKAEATEINGNEEASAEVAESEVLEEKEKRGEKRKAKSPDSEEETAAKKRNSSYLLTHNKPNHPNTVIEPSSTNIFQSNQNRFRIYFDSPPELDRIPKSARRKRGRESSSVAPSRAEEDVEVENETEAVVEQSKDAKVEEEQAQAEVAPVNEQEEENGESGNAEVTINEQAPAELSENIVDPPQVEEADGQVASEAEKAILPETSPEQLASAEQPEQVEEVADIAITSDLGGATASEDAVVPLESLDVDNTTESAPAQEFEEIPVPNPAETEIAGVPNVPDLTAETEPKVEDSEPAETSTNGLLSETVEGEVVASVQNVDPPSQLQVENSATSRSRRQSEASTEYQSTVIGDAPPPPAVSNPTKAVPSTNRLSILYEKSSRRICIDSDVVEEVKIWRKEGKIEVHLKELQPEGEMGLPKGILVESYDSTDQRYSTLNSTNIPSFFEEPDYTIPNEEGKSIPPFHRFMNLSSSSSSKKIENEMDNQQNIQSETKEKGKLILIVYLNKKNPLSEPKWCRNNSADNWLYEQFGSIRKIEKDEKKSNRENESLGWKNKLKIIDPDPLPNLKQILENWSLNSITFGTKLKREKFINFLLNSPFETIEILLKLIRSNNNNDRNSTYSSNPYSFSFFSNNYYNIIKKESPFLNYQNHISFAVLAMYKLTTDLIEKMDLSQNNNENENENENELKKLKEIEKLKLNENLNEIIASLPNNMIFKSLDGLWKEWNNHKQG